MSSNSLTKERQKAIRELVKKTPISDQKQLIELLMKHYKIDTNQAVISRDLRKLGVVKKLVQGVLVYEIPDIDVKAEILRLACIDIRHNESMIVIETHPGLASFVGDCLDQLNDLNILGCLAGENIVFVSPQSIKDIHRIFDAICEKFYFKQKKSS